MNNQNINEPTVAIDLRRFKGMKVEKVLINMISEGSAVLVLSEQETRNMLLRCIEWNEKYKRYVPTYKIDSCTLRSKAEKDRFDAYLSPKTSLQSLFMPQTG